MAGSAKQLALQSRRSRVAELYLKGYRSAQSIADRLGDAEVSRVTVSRDLKVIRREWAAAMVRDFDHALTEELTRIDRIEREAWDEWDRSKTFREKSKSGSKQKPIRGVAEDGTQQRETADEKFAQLEREGSFGDPRYLERISWCIERRCKLLGLDAPEKRELSGKDGGPILVKAEALSDDELEADIARRRDRVAQLTRRIAAEAACAEEPDGLHDLYEARLSDQLAPPPAGPEARSTSGG